MRSDWKSVKLSEITSIIGDGLHGTPKYDENGEYYFINGNNLKDGKIVIKEDTKRVSFEEYLKYKKDLNDRTLFVSINGTIGNIGAYNNEKIILGKSACYFNVNESTDKDFIQYVVTNKNFQNYIQLNATGTTIKNVSLKLMRDYEFILPPIDVQKKIASILKSIDNKIECNNQINNNLEQMVSAIYNSWFINFETFNGTMPSDWKIGTVNSLAKEVICGKTPSTKKNEYYGTSIPFITIPDMHGNTYVVRTERCLSELGANSQHGKNLPPNSICVSCIGTAGLVSLVAMESQTNQQINSIIPKDDFFTYYIYLLMKSLSGVIQARGSGGSTICNLNKGQFLNIEVLVPSENIINDFNIIVAPMFELIKQNQLENMSLTILRESMLSKLMYGEIDVTEVVL